MLLKDKLLVNSSSRLCIINVHRNDCLQSMHCSRKILRYILNNKHEDCIPISLGSYPSYQDFIKDIFNCEII